MSTADCPMLRRTCVAVLLAQASAHMTPFCTSTSPDEPNRVTFHFGTFHPSSSGEVGSTRGAHGYLHIEWRDHGKRNITAPFANPDDSRAWSSLGDCTESASNPCRGICELTSSHGFGGEGRAIWGDSTEVNKSVSVALHESCPANVIPNRTIVTCYDSDDINAQGARRARAVTKAGELQPMCVESPNARHSNRF